MLHDTKIQLLVILALYIFTFVVMKSEEVYFLIFGSLLAVLLSYMVARYNSSQGFRFWPGFIYTMIISIAGNLYLWLWWYGR
jgi:hypothetical protein